MKRTRRFVASVLCAIAVIAASMPMRGECALASPTPLDAVRFEPRVGALLPLDLRFHDDGGSLKPLRSFFGRLPVVVVLGYYSCRVLCSAVVGELARAVADSAMQPGVDVDILFVGIDPRETRTDADANRDRWARRYPRARLQQWHFLTGGAQASQSLAAAIGFRYAYDAAQRQYAHAAGIVIATPEGRIANALFGVQYRPQVLRDAVAAAAAYRIATPPVPLLLRCYHYDPKTGRYSLAIGAVLRIAGAVTVAVLALLPWGLSRAWPRSRTHG
jgi:protein SCO1/2